MITKEEFDQVVVQEQGFDQQVADYMWEDRSAFGGDVEDAAVVLTIESLRKGMPLCSEDSTASTSRTTGKEKLKWKLLTKYVASASTNTRFHTTSAHLSAIALAK